MTPEEAAAIEAAQEKQLRDLATQMAQMTKLGFDPMTIRKGIITAVAGTTSPPTVSINISGDTNTLVSQVRTLNNYTPLVGQTVLVAKQGTEIFLLGSIASVNPRTTTAASEEDNGWIKASLSNGSHYTSSGDNDVHYRRIMDHGSWKMQWRGIWAPGGSTTMIAAGELDPDYRPAGGRPVSCGRNAVGLPTVRMDFDVDGGVRLYTATPVLDIEAVTSMSVSGFSSPTSLSGHDDHVHGSGSYSIGSHQHSGSSITVAAPTWVSLNGVEYFL